MSDFASAAMLRLLAEGLRLEGLQVPAAVDQALQKPGARIALALKRELLEAALAQGGWSLLPRLGRGATVLRQDPTGLALLAARDAASLLARWARLERYVHSRHRLRCLQLDEGGALLRHEALAGFPPPLPAESLVVIGLLAALLQSLGLRASAQLHDLELLPRADETALRERLQGGGALQLSLRWQGAANPAPGPRLPPLFDDPDWSPALQQAASTLQQDLLQPPDLRQMATLTGLPPRSLQRQFARQGWHWRGLQAEARCRAAAWRLLHAPQEPLAAIGYACGFADQAHFTRTLQARTGLTPARYRAAFAAGT